MKSCGCTSTVCLATRNVNLYTVINSPASSGSAEFLRVLYCYLAQNLRDGVTPLGSRLFQSSIGTKVWSEPNLTLSTPALFSAKYKSFLFFFRKFIASLVFMLERYIETFFF